MLQSLISSGEFGAGLKIFEEPRSASRLYQYIPKIGKGVVNYIAFSPLNKLSFDPDVLVILAKTSQTEILLRAMSYRTGKMWLSRFSPAIGCAWIFIYPYLTGELNYTMTGLGHGMKRRKLFPEGMQIVSIPFDLLPSMLQTLQEMPWVLPAYEPDGTEFVKRLLNELGLTFNPKKAWDAILTEQPYPIKAGILCGTNPVVTRANAKEAYEALKKLEFLVVIDFFLTPTAELADIFLPSGTWLEQNHVADNWKRHGFVLARQKCVEIGECWQDHKIFLELGKRMGQEWWPTVEDALDYLLEPAGLTWEQFKEKGYLKGEMVYHKYKQRGFSTPTKKLEIYSTVLKDWGYDPLPKYVEIPESPVSTPEILKDYPYILNAGLRTPTFFHSANRNIPWLREIHPDPIVEIHPETAKKHHINDNQWVYISSPRGRIKQRAKLNDGIDPRVITSEHGWWFPEIKDSGHGWDVSNVNILTDNAYATLDPAIGSTNLRVCLCNIAPCEAE